MLVLHRSFGSPVWGVFFSHRGLTYLHLAPVGFQFFGHKDGQCRVNALSHFRFANEDRDLIVGGNRKPEAGTKDLRRSVGLSHGETPESCGYTGYGQGQTGAGSKLSPSDCFSHESITFRLAKMAGLKGTV